MHTIASLTHTEIEEAFYSSFRSDIYKIHPRSIIRLVFYISAIITTDAVINVDIDS